MALPTTSIRITRRAADRLREYASDQPESGQALASRWILERIEQEEQAEEDRRAERAARRKARRMG